MAAAKPFHCPGKRLVAGGKLGFVDEFIGPMPLIHAAGTAYHHGNIKSLGEKPALRAEAQAALRRVHGQTF